MLEALFLASAGGVIGSLPIALLLAGHSVSTATSAALSSQIVFDLTVDWRSCFTCLVIGATIGMLGGLFPAIRGVRAQVAGVLRTS